MFRSALARDVVLLLFASIVLLMPVSVLRAQEVGTPAD
jgi:hypothetical protein